MKILRSYTTLSRQGREVKHIHIIFNERKDINKINNLKKSKVLLSKFSNIIYGIKRPIFLIFMKVTGGYSDSYVRHKKKELDITLPKYYTLGEFYPSELEKTPAAIRNWIVDYISDYDEHLVDIADKSERGYDEGFLEHPRLKEIIIDFVLFKK